MSLAFPAPVQPGAGNSLTDVAGIRVGHHTAAGDGWLSGTTVVLAPPGGAVAGVDVRGGGPGTRETDLLDPRNAVERVNAVVLSGGSAFGLATASGVAERLATAGEGVRVGAAGEIVVPIVPAAVVFDLGRGGDAGRYPDDSFGAAAYDDAASGRGTAPSPQGSVGAGTGAVAGGLRGGLGSTSAVLADGSTVAALVVANSAGSVFDPANGDLYAARYLLPGEAPAVGRPDPAELRSALGSLGGGPALPMLHTTIGVVAAEAALTKAQCSKVAGIAHDGLARAIRPVHTMFDGDAVFALSTGTGQAPDALAFHQLLCVAADCLARAIAHAVLAATPVSTPAGSWPRYRDLFPSAFGQVDEEYR